MTNYRHARMIDLIANVDSPLLAVHTERCLLVRNRNAECLKCAAVCTSGAIARAEEGIRITPELCIGCGTCASACPTCCLEARNPSDDKLFGEACRLFEQQDGRLVVACSTACGEQAERTAQPAPASAVHPAPQAPTPTASAPAASTAAGTWVTQDDSEALVVTCLGRIDESFLAEAVARGAQEIALVSGMCSDCAHRTGGELSAAICRSAENLLQAYGVPSPIVRTTSAHSKLKRRAAADAETAAHSMQPAPCTAGTDSAATKSATPTKAPATSAPEPASAASGAAVEGTRATADARRACHTALMPGDKRVDGKFAHVQADGTLPHFTPQRRLRLFNSLKRLGRPTAETVETRLWGQVSVNADLCRSCRMCTVFCPTGALSRFDAASDAFGIEHRPTQCVQCNLCEAICPEKAITVSSNVSLEAFASGKKTRITLQPIGWEPGTESAIPTRMARFIKTDTFQDPQAKMKPNRIAQQRSYAAEKQQLRSQEAARRNA